MKGDLGISNDTMDASLFPSKKYLGLREERKQIHHILLYGLDDTVVACKCNLQGLEESVLT